MNTLDTQNLAIFKECLGNVNLFTVRSRILIRDIFPVGREVYYKSGKMPQYKKATVQLADVRDGKPYISLRETESPTQTHAIIMNLDEIELGHPDQGEIKIEQLSEAPLGQLSARRSQE